MVRRMKEEREGWRKGATVGGGVNDDNGLTEKIG